LDYVSKTHEFHSQLGLYWMCDYLGTGKPSQYISNHQDQLSLPSLQGRQIKYQPIWLGLLWDMFICVLWQLTLYLTKHAYAIVHTETM